MASGKDPVVAIGNTLYSSDDVATQAPAPSSEAATGGTLGDDGEGLGDAEGAEAIDLTSLEGEVPKVITHTPDYTRHCTSCSSACAVWLCTNHMDLVSMVSAPVGQRHNLQIASQPDALLLCRC